MYSPGLPLLMAIALKVGGPSGVYYVVPLLGGLCIWLTYVIGARVAGPRTGLVASILLACSPIFLLQLFEPMSDVPVTAWWLMAIVLAMSDGTIPALLAGCAAALALLTRPNLLPLVLPVGLVILRSRPRTTRSVLFVAGLVPACAGIAWLNRFLYGSPFESGYGSLGALFEWARLGANLRRYAVWLVQLHTVFVLLALAAPLARSDEEADRGVVHVATGWLLLGFCGVLWICYLFYIPYDTWPFLRFLLPGVPLLLVLSVAVAMRVISLLPISARGAVAIALYGLLAGRCVKNAADRQIFQTGASEHRYAAVGEYVSQALPQKAVLVSVIESGSIRLYGHRTSVRWDQLAPEQFDTAVTTLEANGYIPYILVEDWEEPKFRERFAHASTFGELNWPPAVQYDGYLHVRIYSLADRSRHLAGERIVTKSLQ